MVELTQFQNASMLVEEFKAIDVALDNLEQGGRIVSMSIAPPEGELPEGTPKPPPMPGAPVSTRGVDYPPAMVTAIKTALGQRQDALAKQLTDMGVTGFQARTAQPTKGK